MKILLTGGSGLLGSEIRKLDPSIVAPPRSELDITDRVTIERSLDKYGPNTVLHLAAATKPPEHEKNPQIGIEHNIIGTAILAQACAERSIKVVYTSTDYLYVGKGPHKESEPLLPPYIFAWSKLGGECAVALVPKHLILRLSFGPVPFPWEQVYEKQMNSKLYVDEMAPLVLALVKTAEEGIMNVGGPRASLEAYARRTRPDIRTIERPTWVPADTSLDISRMCRALDIDDATKILKHGI